MPTATLVKTEAHSENPNSLLARIREGIIGKDCQITTPFGLRQLT